MLLLLVYNYYFSTKIYRGIRLKLHQKFFPDLTFISTPVAVLNYRTIYDTLVFFFLLIYNLNLLCNYARNCIAL
jgi:hypothetical protein